MDHFVINFIVGMKIRDYLNSRHYQRDMLESAASAAEIYRYNKAAATYLSQKNRFTWEDLVKNGNKPRDLIIDIVTTFCPANGEQAMKILGAITHSLIGVMKDNPLFINQVHAKIHKQTNWWYI
ncbi:hypothetical protein [Moellerella wisconsensis]|uniref:ATP-binding protein n=2 Tax=Moellerella wisconsensis TaxID=158849 RepID=A0A9Q8Q4V7_9GAMM|nr:hypothetical protein [Moellerella wisconsensis]KLN97302.1 ATP-binding protein [Moellerella wisconsensis]UNH25415.1 ATP-binding protein [Moellerella wisconsensis]UNH28599.1 ATP-binding protein [Moellerella wisconsensis]UNH32054.1 ATP-binding protein [Moellerella wisconsensis]UNH40163.1 ATP-binding protein [Moellerella wisconsensis]